MIEGILFDEDGRLPVWGVVNSKGQPFYSFKLTEEDEFVMFPNSKANNPKAPKFIIMRSNSKRGA